LHGNEAHPAIFLGRDVIDCNPLLDYDFAHAAVIRL
jgi:hypothetical protein